ncbi:MAG: secretion system protein F [Hyphomicrobium sp.]|nr:MAG: secretion system protein F [Hyphomicrobium sp.]
MANVDLIPLLAPILAAVALVSIVFALMWPYISGDGASEKRIQTVTESRTKNVAARSQAETVANRRKQVQDTLNDIEVREKKEKVTLRLKLQQAGLDITPKSFWMISAGVGVLTMVSIYLSFQPTVLVQLGALVGGFVGMFGLPRWILYKMIQRRQAKFLRELANALDVVTRGVKSGLPLNECLQIVSRESPEPICSEFREVVEQQRIGVSLAEGLERMTQRVPLQEVKFLTIVISIQQQSGGNLSEALANLSGVLRDRIRMQMKVQAMSSEAKASAMVLASLPFMVTFMIYGASPDYIAPLFATKTGNFFVIAGLGWMGCGVMVMRKMINFKY